MVSLSVQTLLAFSAASFVAWCLLTAVLLLRRRRKVTFGAANTARLLNGQPPSGRPLSSTRGQVWVAGMAISWDLVVLEFHPSDLVVRSPEGMFQPLVLSRDAISRVRIERGLLNASLKVDGIDGRELDFSFTTSRKRWLRDALSRAGWLGLLAE